MAEFDLIPPEYRMHRHKVRMFTRLMLAAGLLLAGTTTGLIWFSVHVSKQQSSIDALRAQYAISVQEQQRLQSLQARKEQLQQEKLLLESLGSGTPLPQLVRLVETAVTGNEVWFNEWRFKREGILIGESEAIRQPGSLLTELQTTAFPDNWRSLTQMTIAGEAADHATLSSFVKQLFVSPLTDDVRVQKSTRQGGAIRFTLEISVQTPGTTA